MIDEKPIDKKAIRRLHKEITDNIKMILDGDILEDGEDILLQNSAVDTHPIWTAHAS